jgi:hypothetical protein
MVPLERGWHYATGIIEAHGARPVGDHDPREWLAHWLGRLTRTVRHGGNHKYAWPLDRALRKQMPESRPYPKFVDEEDRQFRLF